MTAMPLVACCEEKLVVVCHDASFVGFARRS